MKAAHLSITCHDLLAVERFRDDILHMTEFLVLADFPPRARGAVHPSLSDRGRL